LRRRIYFWQALGYRLRDSFEPGKLVQPPFPFLRVDSSQPLICALRFGETRDEPERCSTKQNGCFETHSLPTLTRSSPRRFTFYVADPLSSIETRSFPNSLVAYPRDFTFYLADPLSSIHHFEHKEFRSFVRSQKEDGRKKKLLSRGEAFARRGG
jgi:hypothetical protein